MNTQRIVLFGIAGETGKRLAEEALKRGHSVTAIVRNESEFKLKHPNLSIVRDDIKKKEDVSRYARGYDSAIIAHEPSKNQPRDHVEFTRLMLDGLKEAGVHNVVSVAHPFGQTLDKTEKAFDTFKPVVQAQRDALKLYKNQPELHWGYMSSVEPEWEQKSGQYRFSDEVLFTQPHGENRVRASEFTSAVLDEVEKGALELHEHDDEMRL